jgi:cell division protease FtsH
VQSNHKKWHKFGLYTLLGLVVITLGTSSVNSQPAPQGEWSYSKLLEEVRKKPAGVSRITISPDRTFAVVTVSGGSEDKKKVRVKLSNDPNFIRTVTENNIEIDVAPRRTEGGSFQALNSLILLLIGLFFPN